MMIIPSRRRSKPTTGDRSLAQWTYLKFSTVTACLENRRARGFICALKREKPIWDIFGHEYNKRNSEDP